MHIRSYTEKKFYPVLGILFFKSHFLATIAVIYSCALNAQRLVLVIFNVVR